VLGAIDLIGAGLEARDDEAGARGKELRAAVAFGSRLVQQLVVFGREGAEPAESVALGAFLRRVEPVLRRLLRGARFEVDVATREEAFAAIERGELKQVVLNLCVNAGEALLSGGVVRIELRDPRPEEPIPPTSVVLAVADDGRGMDAETQAHMFEPYFTTKPGGLGIGLSTVYGIVKRAGGTILVDSAVGAGTTFRIALPRAAPPIAGTA
jgi:signal transduction histidine kinase